MKLVKLVGIIFAASLCLSCAAGSAATKKASYHYQMGLSNFAEGNYTSALVEFTEAESLTPDDPDGFVRATRDEVVNSVRGGAPLLEFGDSSAERLPAS